MVGLSAHFSLQWGNPWCPVVSTFVRSRRPLRFLAAGSCGRPGFRQRNSPVNCMIRDSVSRSSSELWGLSLGGSVLSVCLTAFQLAAPWGSLQALSQVAFCSLAELVMLVLTNWRCLLLFLSLPLSLTLSLFLPSPPHLLSYSGPQERV